MTIKRKKERRRKPRLDNELVALLKVGDGEIKGTITNHSEDGLFFKSDNLADVGTQVRIEIPSSKLPALDGKIVWTREPSEYSDVPLEGGMGIELILSPTDYLEFVADKRRLQSESGSQRDARYDVKHRVEFRSGSNFLTEYTVNLSKGGMYLATDQELPADSEIIAQIEIPGIKDPVEVKGRVAYRVSPQDAEQKGYTAGVGIQFVELDPETKTILQQYLRRLEVHRQTPQRRNTDKIAFAGLLSNVIVPEILIDFLQRGVNGELVLSRGGIEKRIYFSKGHPIYVDSSLRTEMLGQYLLRHGLINEDDFEASLIDLETSDLRHGEIMVQRGMIEHSALAEALLAHQEEKLFNTFYWFDGFYIFNDTATWPTGLSIFPLRTMRIILAGIRSWYTPEIIRTWMGLEDDTTMSRRTMPQANIEVPTDLFRLLNALHEPKNILQLSEELGTPVDDILPLCFTAVISSWVDVDVIDDNSPEQPIQTDTTIKPQTKKEPTSQPESELVAKKKVVAFTQDIQSKIQRLSGANFYQLLGVTADFDQSMLDEQYAARRAKLEDENLIASLDNHIRSQLTQLKYNLRLAYDTLSDLHLRRIYDDRGQQKSKGLSINLELERIILASFREIRAKHFRKAEAILMKAYEKYPHDSSIQGYLGWALYNLDPQAHLEDATRFIDQALVTQGVDAHLWFFMGCIAFDQKQWWKAEKCFERAHRINPKLTEAKQRQQDAAAILHS